MSTTSPNEWLDYNGPAPVDTTNSATGARWNRYNQAGVITKQNTSITIPSFNDVIPPTSVTGITGYFARMVRQFNYTAAKPFSLVDIYSAINQLQFKTNWTNCFPAIRFRVGSAMTRYVINTPAYAAAVKAELIFPLIYPLYAGQTILPQFCIEVWTICTFPNFVTFPLNIINSAPITFNTSLLNVVNPANSIPSNLSPLVNMGLNDMTVLLPQPFNSGIFPLLVPVPIPFNPNIQWNSN